MANPVDFLKNIYLWFEDRYYGLLDKIGRFVPVYSVVDKIDSFIPSFVLVLILLILLLFFGISNMGNIFPLQQSNEFNTSINVLDSKGEPVSLALLTIGFEEPLQAQTDAWGGFSFAIPSDEIDLNVRILKKGFKVFEKILTFKKDESATANLEEEGLSLEGNEIRQVLYVYSSETKNAIDASVDVSLSFNCSSNASAPASMRFQGGGPFNISRQRSCTVLTATASANNFESGSKVIPDYKKIEYIFLKPLESAGAINVMVSDMEKNPVSGVSIKLFDNADNSLIDSGESGNSGTYSFEKVKAKTYRIAATAGDGRSAEKNNVVVKINEISNVSIVLPLLPPEEKPDLRKKILLKLVDSADKNAVANAVVSIFDNNSLVDSRKTFSDGKFEKLVADVSKKYNAFMRHPNYVLKFLENLELKPINDSNYQLAELVKASNSNSGKILLHVENERGIPVQGAKALIYLVSNPSIPINPEGDFTTVDGNFLFENLMPSAYFLKASKNESFGKSEPVNLGIGQTIISNIRLVLGKGKIEAAVKDYSSNPVKDALVEFFNSENNQLLSSCKTLDNGKCISPDINADKTVYVKASKEGFVPAFGANNIDILADTIKSIELNISPISDFQNIPIETRFLKICADWDCRQVVSKIESDSQNAKAYFARFNLILGQNADYNRIIHHARVGSDLVDEMPLANYAIKIMDVRAPMSSQIVLSKCVNRKDIFSNQENCIVDSGAKTANVLYENPSQSILPITIKFEIEAQLENGTAIEFRYKAKGKVGADLNETAQYLKVFNINRVFCSGNEISWDFELSGNGQTVQVLPESAQKTELPVNTNYAIKYSLYNCLSKDIENAELKVSSIPESFQFSKPVAGFGKITVFSGKTLQRETIFDQNIDFKTVSETAFTDLDFNLASKTQLQNSSREKILHFKINSGKTLNAELPSYMPTIGNPDLWGTIRDSADNNAVESAIVKVYIPSIGTNPIKTALTDSSGTFYVNSLPNLAGNSEITVKIEKSGYKIFTKSIPVKDSAIILPSQNYDCISIEPKELYFNRQIVPEEKTFKIKTTNCNEPVEISMISELQLNPDTVISMAKNDEKTVAVKAQLNNTTGIFLGEYSVLVKARFSSDTQFTEPIQALRIYVNDIDSCLHLVDPANPADFAKMKSTFNLQGLSDNGLIQNSCYYYTEDLKIPSLEKVPPSSFQNPTAITLEKNLPPLRPITGLENVAKWGSQQAIDVEKNIEFGFAEISNGDKNEFYIQDKMDFVDLASMDLIMFDEQDLGKFSVEAQINETYWQPLGIQGIEKIYPYVSSNSIALNSNGSYPPTIASGDNQATNPLVGNPKDIMDYDIETRFERIAPEDGRHDWHLSAFAKIEFPIPIKFEKIKILPASRQTGDDDEWALPQHHRIKVGYIRVDGGIVAHDPKITLNERGEPRTGEYFCDSRTGGTDYQIYTWNSVLSKYLHYPIPNDSANCDACGYFGGTCENPINDIDDKKSNCTTEFEKYSGEFNFAPAIGKELFIEFTQCQRSDHDGGFSGPDDTYVYGFREIEIDKMPKIYRIQIPQGLKAKALRIKSTGSNLTLNSAKWTYKNVDPDNLGKIPFTITNNGLAGNENFATIEAKDYVKAAREAVPAPKEIPFNWTLKAKANQTVLDFTAAGFAESHSINDYNLIALPIAPTGNVSVKGYAFTDSNLNAVLKIAFDNMNASVGIDEDGLSNLRDRKISGLRFSANPSEQLNLRIWIHEGDEWTGHYDSRISQNPSVKLLFDEPKGLNGIALINMGPAGKKTVSIDLSTLELAESRINELELLMPNSSTMPLGESILNLGKINADFAQAPNYDVLGSSISNKSFFLSSGNPEIEMMFSGKKTFFTFDETSEIIAKAVLPEVKTELNSEKFHIRLDAGKQGDCISENGDFGSTGIKAMPHVMFDWSWNLDLNICDKKATTTTTATAASENDYIYCDPTQFSIELLKKIYKVSKLSGDLSANNGEINSLRHFYAYLIEDSYVRDFQNDFDYYYKNNVFFNTPSWYDLEPANKWSKYFSNDSKFVFSINGASSKDVSAGLYEVLIDFKFNEKDWVFFSNNEPAAKITINLKKVSDPIADNIFYHLPFNAGLGMDSSDLDGRSGYGLALSDIQIPLYFKGQSQYVSTAQVQGKKPLSTELITEFNKTNLENRGIVLVAENNGLKFSPSKATPVIMEVYGKNNSAESSYFIRQNDTKTGISNRYLGLWTEFAATKECKGFDGQQFFKKRKDNANAGSCDEAQKFGFEWVPQDEKKVFLNTIFYTPAGSAFNLYKACDDGSIYYSTVFSNAIRAKNSAMPLNYGPAISSLQNVMDLVKAGDICVSEKSGAISFWWNQQKISSQLQATIDRIKNQYTTDYLCVSQLQ